MVTTTAIGNSDGDRQVTMIGRHLRALSVNLAAEDCPVVVRGDARSVIADGVVTALVNLKDNTGDGFWFYEVRAPFASSENFETATCMMVSLAHACDDPAAADLAAASTSNPKDAPRATAIVLVGKRTNLYLITTNPPTFSEADWLRWTEHTIPFDLSVPWRRAGQLESVGDIDRLPINSTDALATHDDLCEVLGTLQSIRIRGGQPVRAQMVLLRTLSILQVVDAQR